jgi:DNA ligase-1
METPFLRLAELCNALENVSKTTKKINLVSSFLTQLEENEIEPAIFLIIGTTFAETDPQTLDISWKTIIETPLNAKQTTLFQQPLTIRSVHSYFKKLAVISGPGARKKRKRLLQTLFTEATPVERKFIIRNIMNEMRTGMGKGLMTKAIAQAAGLNTSYIKRLSAIHGNLGEIGKLALTTGQTGLDSIEVAPFRPIKPMLAESIDTIDVLFANAPQKLAVEYKYDGIRVQVHKLHDQVRLYSRQLKDITPSFPEIVDRVAKTIKKRAVILDGEIVAIHRENNRPLPFQELMRRFRRVRELQRLRHEIAVELYLFDIILLDDEVLFDFSYQKRWELLSQACHGLILATKIDTSDKDEISRFYTAALVAGHEGIVIKDPQSLYYPDERKKSWLKLKEAIRLDLLIIAADWGSGRRTGWLSNFHLAARDPEKGTFHEVGKTFKGLTDAEFKEMTARLQQLQVNSTEYTVYVKPAIVAEVAFNEIQKSPQYPSGYALRFARIKRIRDDKGPEDVTSLDEIADLYDKQFEKKAKL